MLDRKPDIPILLPLVTQLIGWMSPADVCFIIGIKLGTNQQITLQTSLKYYNSVKYPSGFFFIFFTFLFDFILHTFPQESHLFQKLQVSTPCQQLLY